MSAGRDKKARTNVRKGEIARALARRESTRFAMLARRAAKRAIRAALKAKNAAYTVT